MTITRMITITVHLFEPVRPSKSGSIGKFIPANPLANDIENEADNDNCNSCGRRHKYKAGSDSHVELASACPVEWRCCWARAGAARRSAILSIVLEGAVVQDDRGKSWRRDARHDSRVQ